MNVALQKFRTFEIEEICDKFLPILIPKYALSKAS